MLQSLIVALKYNIATKYCIVLLVFFFGFVLLLLLLLLLLPFSGGAPFYIVAETIIGASLSEPHT